MRRAVILSTVSALGLLAAAVAWAATNLNTSRSNAYRVGPAVVMSASATLSGPSETQAALVVPETGEFVLTLVCAGPANGGIRVEAKNLAPLVHVSNGSCVSLQPGISLRPSTTVTCSTTRFAEANGDYFCTVAGLFTR
jgi:hypothetical protein